MGWRYRQSVLDHAQGGHVLTPRKQGGFSLVELMVTVTLIAFLVMLAIPSFSQWIANARLRSAAEEVVNGVRMAQAEAMRRNRTVAFVLTNSTLGLNAKPVANGSNWYVQALPLLGSASSLQAVQSDYVQGSTFATTNQITITNANAMLCFGTLGSVVAIQATAANNVIGSSTSTACTAGAQTYVLSSNSADRSFKVTVSAGGQVRMCDNSKVLSATNPDGC